MAVFVFGTRLLSSSVHSCTCTDTQRGLRANADMHMSILTNTHRHSTNHETQRKGDILDKHCAHTHTLHMLAVMKPEENGKISYSFLCSHLERVSFFCCVFSHCNEHIYYLPFKSLETFACCVLSTGPVHIEMYSFRGFWNKFER